jgi:outer membrane protein OmpA-like peptidoglycan-associated protein
VAFREVRDEFGEGWAFCCLSPMELGERCRGLGLDAIEAAQSFLAHFSSSDLRTICQELCWAGPQLDRCSDARVLSEIASRMARGQLVVCEAEHARRIFEQERQRLGTALQPYGKGVPLPASAPMPEPPTPTDTWFKVKVVDEMSEPLPSVELLFSFDGQVRATDGAGTIEVNPVAGEHHQTAVRTPPSTPASTDGVDAGAALDSLRAAVKPSWDEVRPGPWYEPGPDDVVVQLHGQAPIDTSLLSERLRTIVVQPWVVRVRLLGAYFDTNKCFLLPSAVTTASGGTSDMQAVRRHILENPRSTPLIVGHTDASGEPAYNDPLSLERADAVAAYLRNDADAWLSWYGATRPPEKRWGANEDQSMLSALPDYGTRSSGEAPVWWFQRTRGLGLDGVAGPETRGALIREYMALGGGALPADVELTTHGCGESFPREDLPSEGAADEAQAKQQQRRVEIYLFDRPLGVQPPPPGEISKPGSIEYPEWVRRARETHDYSPGAEVRSELWVRFELTPESAASRTDELRLEVHGGGVLASKRLGVDHLPNESTVDVPFLDLPAACPLSLEIVPASGSAYEVGRLRECAGGDGRHGRRRGARRRRSSAIVALDGAAGAAAWTVVTLWMN